MDFYTAYKLKLVDEASTQKHAQSRKRLSVAPSCTYSNHLLGLTAATCSVQLFLLTSLLALAISPGEALLIRYYYTFQDLFISTHCIPYTSARYKLLKSKLLCRNLVNISVYRNSRSVNPLPYKGMSILSTSWWEIYIVISARPLQLRHSGEKRQY